MNRILKIAFLGDLALFGRFDLKTLPENYFSDVANFLSDFDLVVANLEAPLVKSFSHKSNKSALISSNEENIKLIKLLHINVVCLANNHIFDYGLDGVRHTINLLNNNNIQWYGLNNKSLHFWEDKFSLHGFCSYNTNPVGSNFSKDFFLNMTDFSTVINCVKNDLSNNMLSIICNHSGVENVKCPSKDDLDFARHIASLTDYIYIGHHPHVIQGSEEFKNSYLTYSLGNFCFDDIYDERTNQLLVKQGEHNKHGLIKTFELIEGKVKDTKEFVCYQSDNKLLINVKNYSYKQEADSLISVPDINYCDKRAALISDSIKRRNNERNLTWFLSRVNFSTLSRVALRRLNAFKYKKHFSSKIPR